MSEKKKYLELILAARMDQWVGCSEEHPTALPENFVDRFGPAHDKAYMLFENELRKDTGGEDAHRSCGRIQPLPQAT